MNKLTKTTLLLAIVGLFAVPANAQFGKSLKKLTKTVTDVATSTAGDMAANVAATSATNKIVEWMDTNNKVVDESSPYYTRLSSLVADKYTSIDGSSFNYKVYENPEVNMIACADGSIRIYSGMMDFLTDEELTAVIATQIGHVNSKNARENLLKIAKGSNSESAAASQLGKMLSGSGEKLGSVINELLQIPYTEDQIKKADAYAYNLLKNNGAGTTGLVSAFNKFAALEASDAEAEETEGEVSAASNFIKVNSNNSLRASLASSK